METFVQDHINTAINVWQTCVRRSHRARSFRAVTHIILTLSLLALRAAPALFILNRVWMIRSVSVFSQLITMAYLLLYATSLEYHICLDKSGTQRISQIVPVYESTLTVDRHTAIRSVVLILVIGIPMFALGVDLLFFNKGNL